MGLGSKVYATLRYYLAGLDFFKEFSWGEGYVRLRLVGF